MTGPPPASARYWLNRALFDLGEPAWRQRFEADRAAWLDCYPLDADARAALDAPEWKALLDRGALPNLVFKYFMMHGHLPGKFAAIAGEAGGDG